MRGKVKVKCAKCGTWYWHIYNTPYRCPKCGSSNISDWEILKGTGKFGTGDRGGK